MTVDEPLSVDRSRLRREESLLSFLGRPLRSRSFERLDGRPRLEALSSLLEPPELVPLLEPPEVPRDRFGWLLLPLPPDLRLVPLLLLELLLLDPLLRVPPLLRLEPPDELPRLEPLLPPERETPSPRERWALAVRENSAITETVRQIDITILAWL
jgi:hypothetical protein